MARHVKSKHEDWTCLESFRCAATALLCFSWNLLLSYFLAEKNYEKKLFAVNSHPKKGPPGNLVPAKQEKWGYLFCYQTSPLPKPSLYSSVEPRGRALLRLGVERLVFRGRAAPPCPAAALGGLSAPASPQPARHTRCARCSRCTRWPRCAAPPSRRL